MQQRMMNWLLQKQTDMTNKKHPHVCHKCEEISSPTKRLSILNLLAWLAIGIVAGVLTWMFTNVPIGFVFGFITTLTLTVINSKLIKPSCAKCFSTDIEYVGWNEVLRLRKEKEETESIKAGNTAGMVEEMLEEESKEEGNEKEA